jgi:AcrR family transcriptional regulator
VPKIGRERTEENQRRIEAAALALFTTQGFHGTNNRDIAEKIGTSTGTLYTYFPSKEAIYSSLAHKYRIHLEEWLRHSLGRLNDPVSKMGAKQLAAAVKSAMYEEPEYFLLLLSDVIEFKNRHFLELFHDMPQQFRRVLGRRLEEGRKQKNWRGEDPAFVLASMYGYFFTYFLMERYMQGQQHLGLPDDQATAKFVDLIFDGLWMASPSKRTSHAKKNEDSSAKLHQADRERIDYIRFLSGRLWSLPPDVPQPHSDRGDGEDPSRRSILFLPQIPRDRIDENQVRIEAAALDLFTKQGFHGTNIREIAEKAGVSQGAIYTYYSSKEAVFEGLVRSYRHSMRHFMERVFRIIEDPFSERDLRLFAAAMRAMVYDDAEYWLLMYIDVVEFKNRHFLTVFQNVPEQFRRLLGPAIAKTAKRPGWCGLDPALAMAMIYFYFHTYFVIERVMHGNRHLGISDEDAVERFIDILCHGVLGASASASRSSAEPRGGLRGRQPR